MECNSDLGHEAVQVIHDLVTAEVDDDDSLIQAAFDRLTRGGVPLLAHVVNLMCVQIMKPYRPPVTVEFTLNGRVVEPTADSWEEAGQLHAARLCVAKANNDVDMFNALFSMLISDPKFRVATLLDLARQMVGSATSIVVQLQDAKSSGN